MSTYFDIRPEQKNKNPVRKADEIMFCLFRKKEEPYVSILAGAEDESLENETAELRVSAVSDVGFVRRTNEDNFYADGIGVKPGENCLLSAGAGGRDMYIFAVFDGMGGEAYGELASEISARTLSKSADAIRHAASDELHRTVNDFADAANAAVCRMAWEKRCGRSGSTFAMVCIASGMVYSFNIGDSRVYYFRNGNITRLSEDHTLAERNVRAGFCSEEEARSGPDSHKLITFLGVDDDGVGLTASACEPVELADGKVLICSDGLTDMCSDSEIARVLAEKHSNYAEALVEKALQKGGWDNVTCIVIEAV